MRTINIKQAIKEYFLTNPTAKLRVRGIERELKLPLPSVIRYCKELMKESILTSIKTGDVVFYTADKANEKFILEKRFYNIRKVYDSGMIDQIKQELSNPPIVLFGSFARGEDIERSDIDLYIETSSKKEIKLERFEKFLKRRIQIFRKKSIGEIENPHLANNIINGVVLNNHLEVFK